MILGRFASRLNSESSTTTHTRRYNLFTICLADALILRAFAKRGYLANHPLHHTKNETLLESFRAGFCYGVMLLDA
jgi:hypothetical protein